MLQIYFELVSISKNRSSNFRGITVIEYKIYETRFSPFHKFHNRRERSGLVVECLTQDRGAAGSSLTGVTVLWSLSKTHLS